MPCLTRPAASNANVRPKPMEALAAAAAIGAACSTRALAMSTSPSAIWKPNTPAACSLSQPNRRPFSDRTIASYNCARWRLFRRRAFFILLDCVFGACHMTSRIQAPVLLALLYAGLSAMPAHAQLSELTTASKDVPASSPAPTASPFSSQRESEYAALARDVETLGREFSS